MLYMYLHHILRHWSHTNSRLTKLVMLLMSLFVEVGVGVSCKGTSPCLCACFCGCFTNVNMTHWQWGQKLKVQFVIFNRVKLQMVWMLQNCHYHARNNIQHDSDEHMSRVILTAMRRQIKFRWKYIVYVQKSNNLWNFLSPITAWIAFFKIECATLQCFKVYIFSQTNRYSTIQSVGPIWLSCMDPGYFTHSIPSSSLHDLCCSIMIPT